ncbi:MAG: ribosome small subunit-dependent GTPase A [Candidatus Latescibacteria bacterium]|nr:ribosome small subunit-dependent GTPase A [Candidatus Latescibacterota bacterium]
MDLNNLGWDPFFAQHFEAHAGLLPARVACQHRDLYLVYSTSGELTAEVPGKWRHTARSPAEFPAVGDWVGVRPREEDKATIHALLPRKSRVARKAAGGRERRSGGEIDEQIIAANIDTLFLVNGLDGDFNLRRLERYLTLAWDSGADPVIVLNKADQCPEVEERVAQVEGIAFGVPVHAISALARQGLEALSPYLSAGRTVAVVGSSGVGKSTLTNSLLGEQRLKVTAVREDDGRGRHTTSHRELVLLDQGGLIVDTPGMRELQLWADEEDLSEGFVDVEELAARCRFGDCRHQREPGCAVRGAVERGRLEAGRLESYHKLKRELEKLSRRQEQKARLAERATRKNGGKKREKRGLLVDEYET